LGMRGLLLALVAASVAFCAPLTLVVTEQELQAALEDCIDDTHITDLEVDIQSGQIELTAVRTQPLQTVDLDVVIWLDPGDENNVWTVKEATANGEPFGPARIAVWNAWFTAGMETMAATNLGRADRITIEPDQITMEWD
jgi:hypothetical protein